MAVPKLAKDEAAILRSLRATAKTHAASGLSPKAAMAKALDDELASVDEQIASVQKQATPKGPKQTERIKSALALAREAQEKLAAATALTEQAVPEDDD
jgi:hypothetical protein